MAWFMSKRKCANKPEGKWILQFLAFLLIATTVVRGPAPGDADEVCVTSPLRPLLVNQDILMASFNYRSLVEGSGGPWAVVDLDGNNNEVAGSRSPIWSQSGTTCERITTACGYLSGAQDNWLITQYINNTARRDMYISVKYTINADCGQGCSTVLDMYVLQTNETDQNFARNVNNFPSAPLFSLTDTVRDGITITTEIIRIGSLSTPGLYVAFRDTGTCLSIAEVVVYYPACDAFSLTAGATFTNDGHIGDILQGSCFPNMAVDINTNPTDNTVSARCVLDSRTLMTSWNSAMLGEPDCMCRPGFVFTSRSTADQCEACPPFTFKNTLSNTDTCQPCPSFSNTTESDTGVAVCPCDPGYYRIRDDPTLPCVAIVAPYNVVIMGDNIYDNGDQLELHCSSEGGPDFKYSWNRTNLFSVTTTTNTSTLTISNLTTVDGGNYTCTATNDNGTSMNTITVYVAPYNVVINGDNTYDNGDQLELNCSSEGGPDLVYSWSRMTNDFLIVTNTATDNLKIDSAATIDGGEYTCTVANDAGTNSHTITVYIGPVFTTDPVAKEVVIKNSFTLDCTAEGFPRPYIQWYLNNTIITNSRNINTTSINSVTSTLIVMMAEFNDSGVYYCEAVSGRATVKSSMVNIIVVGKGEGAGVTIAASFMIIIMCGVLTLLF
ncbi:uncharacterized protein [Dysidea avara]|uniref:uncharacterized protein isoform X2 n=1 Tax=Dysidea avara TaxID=196820 RepID=UPI003320311B